MLNNKFIKRNWNTIFNIILILGLLSILASVLFNVPLLSKVLSADGTIEEPYISCIHLTQFTLLFLGSVLLVAYFRRKDIKKSLLRLQHATYPQPLHILLAAFLLFNIFIIIFFWQNPAVSGEGELLNDLSITYYFIVVGISFLNFLLTQNTHRRKYFWLIFSILFLVIALDDLLMIHEAIQNFILGNNFLPTNTVTLEIHALFPIAIAVLGLYTIYRFWNIIQHHKNLAGHAVAAVSAAFFSVIFDVFMINIYFEESLEMMMAVFFILVFTYAFFDNL